MVFTGRGCKTGRESGTPGQRESLRLYFLASAACATLRAAIHETMLPCLKLLTKILENGAAKEDRNGTGTLSISGGRGIVHLFLWIYSTKSRAGIL